MKVLEYFNFGKSIKNMGKSIPKGIGNVYFTKCFLSDFFNLGRGC